MDSFRLRFVSCPANFPDARITPEEGDIVKFERRRVDNKPIEFEGGGGIALMQHGLFSGWIRKDEKELVTDDMFQSRWKVTSIYHIWDFEEGGGESRLGYVGRAKGDEGSSHDSVMKDEKIENVDGAHGNAIKEEQAENLMSEHLHHEINRALGVDEEGIVDGEESSRSNVEDAQNEGGQSEDHEEDSGAEGIEDLEGATSATKASGDERGGYVNKRDREETESDGEDSVEEEPVQIKKEPEEEKSPQKRRRVMEALKRINI